MLLCHAYLHNSLWSYENIWLHRHTLEEGRKLMFAIIKKVTGSWSHRLASYSSKPHQPAPPREVHDFLWTRNQVKESIRTSSRILHLNIIAKLVAFMCVFPYLDSQCGQTHQTSFGSSWLFFGGKHTISLTIMFFVFQFNFGVLINIHSKRYPNACRQHPVSQHLTIVFGLLMPRGRCFLWVTDVMYCRIRDMYIYIHININIYIWKISWYPCAYI